MQFREPDLGEQQEAAGERSRDRAERVERVESRQRRPHPLVLEVTDQHRQRGAHERRGRKEQDE
jgi:hypothetical protein